MFTLLPCKVKRAGYLFVNFILAVGRGSNNFWIQGHPDCVSAGCNKMQNTKIWSFLFSHDYKRAFFLAIFALLIIFSTLDGGKK